jgi:uncharacterized small protein (DUF1192 family)
VQSVFEIGVAVDRGFSCDLLGNRDRVDQALISSHTNNIISSFTDLPLILLRKHLYCKYLLYWKLFSKKLVITRAIKLMGVIELIEKMNALKSEFADLLKAEAKSKKDLLSVFKELGYEIKL